MSSRPRGAAQLPVGPLVGAIGAVLLLVSLFLDWYEGLTAFTVFEFVDVVLVLCALLTIASLAGGLGVVKPPPVSPGLSLAVALFTIFVVLVQLVNDPPAVAGGTGPDRDIGIWLAVAGASLMAAGAVLATAHISLSIEPRASQAHAPGASEPTPRPDSEAPTQRDTPGRP